MFISLAMAKCLYTKSCDRISPILPKRMGSVFAINLFLMIIKVRHQIIFRSKFVISEISDLKVSLKYHYYCSKAFWQSYFANVRSQKAIKKKLFCWFLRFGVIENPNLVCET